MSSFAESSLAFWCRSAALAAVLMLSAIAGCKSVDWKGDNFHDDMAQWGEKQRPPDEPENGGSEMLGLSAKSQQVERNLGVR